MEQETMSFGKALDYLKNGDPSRAVTIHSWYGSSANPRVLLQRPDVNSKMTKSYLYMEKKDVNGNIVRFPLDLSCESILSDEWIILK